MIKKIEGIKNCWLIMAVVCVMSFGMVTTTGCAGKTKTSTVTTETTNGAMGGSTSYVTTEREEVTTSAHPRGVIGGVFYTIGQVLIFPFRVIGNLFT